MTEKYADGKFVVHPDIKDAFKKYKGREVGGDSLQRTFRFRNAMLDACEDIVYWDGDHDVEMKEIAEERTVTKATAGWRYPKRMFRRQKKEK